MSDYKGSCFVIMSFADDDRLRDSYQFGVEQTVEGLGYRCIRVDKQHFNGSIREYILRSLREADFIVADVSHARPNCYYELGMAHALGKEVIHITNKTDDVHFDIQDFNFIVYQGAADLASKLKPRLEHTIANLKRNILHLTRQPGQLDNVEAGVLASLTRDIHVTTALVNDDGLDAMLARADVVLYSYQPAANAVQQAQLLVEALKRQPGKTLVVYYDGRIEADEYAVLRQHPALAIANMHTTLKERLQESLK